MKVYLEALSEQDFTTIIEWINQEDEDFIVQWAGLTFSYPLTIEQLKAHYSKGIILLNRMFLYIGSKRQSNLLEQYNYAGLIKNLKKL